MRKAHDLMVNAFWGGYGKRKANDVVARTAFISGPQQMEWYYHGHRIAWSQLDTESGIHVSFCGYGTYSTKARLNALMDKFGYQRFYQKDFRIYYGLVPIEVARCYDIEELDQYNKHLEKVTSVAAA
jgi:hypothetical protein